MAVLACPAFGDSSMFKRYFIYCSFFVFMTVKAEFRSVELQHVFFGRSMRVVAVCAVFCNRLMLEFCLIKLYFLLSMTEKTELRTFCPQVILVVCGMSIMT